MSDEQDPLPEGCDLCGDQGPLLLSPRCHLTAPVQVLLDHDMMIIRCYLPECQREVARFPVQRMVPKPD